MAGFGRSGSFGAPLRPTGNNGTNPETIRDYLEGMHDQFNPLAVLRPQGPLAGGPVRREPLGPSRPARPRPKPKPKPASSGNRGSGSNGSGNRTVTRYGTTSSGGSGGPTGGSGWTRPPRQPKTYKGPNGEVRRYLGRGATQGGGAAHNHGPAGPAKPVKDPLEELVDQIIASRLAPIQDERRQLREQSAADVLQQERLNEKYQSQLGAIRSDGQLDMGAALAKAAELRGISAETLAANQEWLSSLMADTNGGTGDAQVAEASAQQNAYTSAAHDTMAREIGTRGENMSDWTAKQQVVGTAQTNELINQERLRRAAAERGMASEISQVRGGRAEMLYQMQQAQQEAALKQAVAEQEWGLKVAAQNSTDAYRQGQLALGSQRNMISAANAANRGQGGAAEVPESQQGRFPGIPKRYDTVISDTWKRIDSANKKGELAQPWRSGFSALHDQGLSPAYAAMVASRWFPGSITSSTPYNIRKMLENRGVPAGIVRNILTQSFGKDAWAQSQNSSAMGQTAQSILDNTRR